MRKFILTFTLIVSVFVGLNAQVDGKAIGLRFGGFDGYGAEVSYQHPLGKVNRLEVDLGISHYGFGLGGVYQWVWDLSDLAPGFNWYAGVGASLGSYDFNDTKHDFGIGALGQIGLEYNFNIPLQISVDYRPGIYLIPRIDGLYDGICLSARYKF